MSIVSVHGPNMWGGTGAGGGGTGPVTTAPQVQATADQSNGFKFTFEATDKTRVAADYDWAFPGGTPATQADSKGPITVTYSTAGQKTATLTVAAGAGPPAGGAYPITVTAISAGPRSVEEQSASPVEATVESPVETTVEESVEVSVEDSVSVEQSVEQPAEGEVDEYGSVVEDDYDPADHTVGEVTEHAKTLDDEGVKALIAAEEAGKNRTTLVAALNELLPFDPADFNVSEVLEYVEAYPEELDAVIELEQEGKNRSTLMAQLEEKRQ